MILFAKILVGVAAYVVVACVVGHRLRAARLSMPEPHELKPAGSVSASSYARVLDRGARPYSTPIQVGFPRAVLK
jgi:hypothetical protein